MKVEDVMARTGLSRPAFYAYFRDRYELVTRLLEGIGGLLFAVDRRWLVGDPGVGREESAAILREALRGGAETFRSLRAGAAGDLRRGELRRRVEEMYRFGLIERLIVARGGAHLPRRGGRHLPGGTSTRRRRPGRSCS